MRKQGEAVLLDYLHFTRNLQFLDAEHFSKNSPRFLKKLMKKVQPKSGDDIRKSLARYFRYHPINEFELFFESMGLKPIEYTPYLSHGMIFLSDDELSLENYHVLCDYGVARVLRALEKLGFSKDVGLKASFEQQKTTNFQLDRSNHIEDIHCVQHWSNLI
ncbi:hypothetical protein ACFE04_031266 [Oxalis oulophora]